MRAEQHFLEAIETLGRTGPGELDAASAAVRQLLASMGTAQRLRTDVRPYAVAALHALDLDDKEQAKDWGMRAAKLGVHWPPWQRTFFGDRLQRLAALEPWAPLLR